jgi:hypothetical protein
MAIAVMTPLALLMGMPFPLGLARLGRSTPAKLPMAWAVNGCFSVIGAVGAQITALSWGFGATVAAGVALYLFAAYFMPAPQRP